MATLSFRRADGHSLTSWAGGHWGTILGPTPLTAREDPLRRKDTAAMTYVIAQPCVDVKDRACVDECPVDCIYEGERSLYINADECVDCGACEPVCPTEAIFYEDDVPEEWEDYTRANIDFFELKGLGLARWCPGGPASRTTTTR